MFFLLLSLLTNAASFSATVQAWNKASLSGDVTDAMSVEFLSTSKSAGKITADNTAQMTISGLPACTVNAITLHVRSNQSSGAGLVALSLANQTWIVASGAFDQWPGMNDFSTTAQPLQGLTYPIPVKKNAQLILYMEGTENSVYIEQLVVDYTLTPPSPHTLTLQWPSQTGTMLTRQLTETEAGAGIILPSVDAKDSIILLQDETWYWIGWCRPHFGAQSKSPNYWETGDWFNVDDDYTLHALYTNVCEQTLVMDTSFRSGEYAMVFIAEGVSPQHALAGGWKSGSIAMQDVVIQKNNGEEYTWTVSCLDDSYRYLLNFTDDSVSIYHPLSQTWIGYATTSPSLSYSQWAWQPIHHSLLIYRDLTPAASAWRASCLSISYDSYSKQYMGVYKTDIVDFTISYWYLFSTASLPNSEDIRYTTFGEASALPATQPTSVPCRKYLNPQGQIIIQNNNQQFNLLGQSL